MQSVLSDQITGRIILGIIITIILVGTVVFVCLAKKNHKHKHWFAPIGLKGDLYTNRFLIWKSDYPIWLGVAIVILLYWLGSYLIVNLIQMAQFNLAISEAQLHGGIKFVWVPDKVIFNGEYGGFDAIYVDNTLPTGESLMPFVMKQTNVTYYLFNMVNDLIKGNTNLENASTPFLNFPDPFIPTGINLDPTIPTGLNSVNDTINNLSEKNQLYLYQQMMLWLHSFNFSNIFLTPLCQCLSVVFPLSIALSYKKDIASFFAPWAFLGGIITIYGGIVADENVHITWQLIFFDQQWFFGYHTYLMIGGLSWMVYSNRYSLIRCFYTYVFITFYVAYVWMITRAININYFTTGLTRLDYSASGSYIIASIVLRDSNIIFPGNAAIMIFAFTSFLNLVISIKNIIHTRFWKKRINNYDETFVNDIKIFVSLIKNKLGNLKNAR